MSGRTISFPTITGVNTAPPGSAPNSTTIRGFTVTLSDEDPTRTYPATGIDGTFYYSHETQTFIRNRVPLPCIDRPPRFTNATLLLHCCQCDKPYRIVKELASIGCEACTRCGHKFCDSGTGCYQHIIYRMYRCWACGKGTHQDVFERLKPEWRCQECGLALDGSGGTVYTATKLFGVYQRSFSKFIIIPQDEVEMVVKEIRLMEERERGGVRKCVEVLEE